MSCFEWGLCAKLGHTQDFSPVWILQWEIHTSALAKTLPTGDQSLAMTNSQVGAEAGAVTEAP